MDHEGLKLERFSRYDFELESIFKFILVFKNRFLMQYECMIPCNMSAVLVKRKRLQNIYGICIVGGKVTLIPIVSSNEIILRNHG
jgi:hypothetical protein